MGVRTDPAQVIKTQVRIHGGRIGGNSKWEGKWRLTVTDDRSRSLIVEVNLEPEEFMNLVTGHTGDKVEAEAVINPNLGRWYVTEAIHIGMRDRDSHRERGAPDDIIDEAWLLLRGKFPNIKDEDWHLSHARPNNARQWVVVFGRYVDSKPEGRW